jgi:hypothetical protein
MGWDVGCRPEFISRRTAIGTRFSPPTGVRLSAHEAAVGQYCTRCQRGPPAFAQTCNRTLRNSSCLATGGPFTQNLTLPWLSFGLRQPEGAQEATVPIRLGHLTCNGADSKLGRRGKTLLEGTDFLPSSSQPNQHLQQHRAQETGSPHYETLARGPATQHRLAG